MVRLGRVKKFSGRVCRELWERSRKVSAVRSAKVSGKTERLLLCSYGEGSEEVIRWLVIRTSMVFKEPKSEISGCISTIRLLQAFMISRSWALNHAGLSFLPFRSGTVSSLGGRTGSSGTDFNGAGVMSRWISNRADGRQRKSREQRLITPVDFDGYWRGDVLI